MTSPTVSRALAVNRMHLTDTATLFVMPLAIVAASFVINIVIWTQVAPDGRQTGGAAAAYVFALVAAAFAVVRGLPFALGMGASRRAFVLGTALTGLTFAAAIGTLFLLLGGVERLTDGWWLQGRFFAFPWFDRSPWPVLWLLLVVSLFATFALGAVGASVYARWSTLGLVVGGPSAVLVLGAAAVLVTWQGWWHDVGHWFAGLTPLTASAWLLLVTAALCAATWGSLRRVRA